METYSFGRRMSGYFRCGIVCDHDEPWQATQPNQGAGFTKVRFDDIGGNQLAKGSYRSCHRSSLNTRNFTPSSIERRAKGVLLYGPPGCGKTLIGKALATSVAELYERRKEAVKTICVKEISKFSQRMYVEQL